MPRITVLYKIGSVPAEKIGNEQNHFTTAKGESTFFFHHATPKARQHDAKTFSQSQYKHGGICYAVFWLNIFRYVGLMGAGRGKRPPISCRWARNALGRAHNTTLWYIRGVDKVAIFAPTFSKLTLFFKVCSKIKAPKELP